MPHQPTRHPPHRAQGPGRRRGRGHPPALAVRRRAGRVRRGPAGEGRRRALKVLTPAQYATVEALVEAIIPADERSPGAKEARVADYMDLLLSEAPVALRQEWLDGLAALDAEATSRFGAPFVRLDAAQVEAVLADISRYELLKPRSRARGPRPRRHRAGEEPKPKPPQVDTLLGDVRRHDPRRRRRWRRSSPTRSRPPSTATTRPRSASTRSCATRATQVLAEFVGCQTVDGKDCPHCGQKAEA